ncbi:MAG: disulfide bond formation protein B [Pelagibacteraceae bacterium]|nr:disulfide bond formation protein B [Pelagibacteraceae bacterium]
MKNKTTLNIILFLSIISLVSAYFIEYILGYKPCNLCLIERLPYFITIIIILIGSIVSRLEKIILITLALIFSAATILSFYHFGIEQGFFNESLVCISNNEINNLSKEDLLKELQKEVVSCKDVQFTLLGLSLATINAIISFILSVITFMLFLNFEKKIKKFRDDEIHHKNIAYDNGASKEGLYSIFNKIIKTGSKIAINISEKI